MNSVLKIDIIRAGIGSQHHQFQRFRLNKIKKPRVKTWPDPDSSPEEGNALKKVGV